MLSWVKDNSPVNLALFPGRRSLRQGGSSYLSDGIPFVGRRRGGDGELYTSRLLWTADLNSTHAGVSRKPKLHVLVVERDADLNPTRSVVLLLHGNGCDVGEVAGLAETLSQALRAHVVVPEYPGYGEAPGTPSEGSINAAARSAATLITQLMAVPVDRLVILGQSVGTGPAAALAEWLTARHPQTPPRALVLHSPYTNLRDLAKSMVGAVGGLALQRWDTQTALLRISSPTLLLHGDKDVLIPYQHSRTMYDARHRYTYTCRLHTQPGVGHNDWDADVDVVQPIRRFLQDLAMGSGQEACPTLSPNDDRVTTDGLVPLADCERYQDILRASMHHGIEMRSMPYASASGKLQKAMSGMGSVIAGSVALSAGATLGALAASGRGVSNNSSSDADAIGTMGSLLHVAGCASGATAAAAPVTAPVLGPVGAASVAAGIGLQKFAKE